MSSNFRNFEIETIDGKIQNVSSLCDYVRNTQIVQDDLPYLESLCNKLANDDAVNNNYTNEYPLVEALHEVLLKYYIDYYMFDIDQIIDVLEVYNNSFINIEKKVYDDHIYILFDRYDSLNVILVEDEKQFINAVLSNLNTFVAGSFEDIYELMNKLFISIDFKETSNDNVISYAEKFGIEDSVYEGRDKYNNRLFTVKNGLLIEDNNELKTIVTPTTLNKDNHIEHKIVSINKKYQGFDLADFVYLRDKAMNGDFDDESEVQRFYYEVRYLINTMGKREDNDSEESEALDIYMNSLMQIYDAHKDILTPADKRNIQNYLDNKQKYSRKVS